MKHLVIGNGEIGKALSAVLGCTACDVEGADGQFDVIHICFPFSADFAAQVASYRERHGASHVVVHSTVPVGTCRAVGAIHSPVTGVHPHLEASIRTFRKPVGGPFAGEIVEEFKSKGIPAEEWSSSDATEAGKLYALLIYGVNVLLEKEAHAFCAENGIDYRDAYGRMVELYNDGYQSMGMPHFRMYELEHRDGKIGGHCVTQNAPLLGTPFARFLAERNDALAAVDSGLDTGKGGKMSLCNSTPTPPARI